MGNRGCKRKDYAAEKVDCKLTETAHLFLIHQLIHKPGINLRELKDSLLVGLGISVIRVMHLQVLEEERIQSATHENVRFGKGYRVEKAVRC